MPGFYTNNFLSSNNKKPRSKNEGTEKVLFEKVLAKILIEKQNKEC